MKLHDEERLQDFGLFKIRFNESPGEKRVKVFMENFIKSMDQEFSCDEIENMNYEISAISSVLNMPTDHKRNYYDMTEYVRKRVERLQKLVRESYSNPMSIGHHIFDHVYWYRDNDKDKLVIEVHPYSELNNADFTMFNRPSATYPFISVSVHPNSYYFANHTLYIQFIIEYANKFMDITPGTDEEDE